MRKNKKDYKLDKNYEVRNLEKEDKIYINDANDEIKIIK